MSEITELEVIYEKLVAIKDYLVKVGPSRRQHSEAAQQKFQEELQVYNRLESISSVLETKTEAGTLQGETLRSTKQLFADIIGIHRQILSLRPTEILSKSVDSQTESSKMALENFDIKTAIALLPIMSGQEQVTLQLMDSIQLYSSMLNDAAKKQLIEFVLKTRLSANAKLRLRANYESVESLLKDMRTHLIQKKSAVALQSQIFAAKQGRRSIDKFGTDLEQLLVNLTLAQADGDDHKYEVFRQMNEKLAIKRFADGLNNSRLSTIVASRQFNSLPEAIQSAIDENSLAPSEEQALHFNGHRAQARSTRGRGGTRTNPCNQSRTFHNSNPGQFRGRGRGTRDRPTRGLMRGRSFHRSYDSRQIAQVQHSQNRDNVVECTQNAPNNDEFFRSHDQ